MSRVIAGIYELQKEIGSGGGGIVYLGRHLRLKKQVVLKADRRTLDTKDEVLRREVDMLKGLSHTYIPQVYDFVQEDGVVYTVMDFIEGESLDKLLQRDVVLKQPQVIWWACQLLEALVYLHSRPPHGILHGDIKPANIMLRPDGNICLIDYNIALALGENGAVKVGRSRGYASPEHYGIDYGSGHRSSETVETTEIMVAESVKNTESMDLRNFAEVTENMVLTGAVEKTETMASGLSGKDFSGYGGSTTGGRRSIMLDVRSDIYSLGATLYHLLSGRRPAQNAIEVEPLGRDVCSSAVSDIVKKAMMPDPSMRYQSAQEMLKDFRKLHRSDKRTVRHKRCMAVSGGLLAAMFLAGGACTFTGLKQMEQRQNALTLAEYSSNRLSEGDISGAVELAIQAIPDGKSIFDAPVTAQAQKALTDALGVYDLSEGFKSLDAVKLPSAPFEIVISPKGTRFAVMYQYEAAVFDTESGSRLLMLPAQNSALADVLFLDEARIVYAGDKGVTAYDLDTMETLWTGDPATTLSVSADGTTVAAVNRDEEFAVIYQFSDGKRLKTCSFGGKHMPVAVNDIFADPGDSIFSLSRDGSMLAVSFSGGGLQIFDLDCPDEDLILYDESDYSHFEGGFCGKYFAFAAKKSNESLFGLIDVEDAVYVGGLDSETPFVLNAAEKGIYLSNDNLLVHIDPDTLKETELAYADQAKITGFSVSDGYVLTATDDRNFSFYDGGANRMSSESCKEPCDFVVMSGRYAVIGNRNEPSVRIMKRENREEYELLSYDTRYIHDETRISQDGQTAMLFSYQSFRIYDMDGRMLNQTELPDPDHIYDQQYIKNEQKSWLEVIWYDGTVRRYDAADGSIIETITVEPPSMDLYEEFYTDQYRFTSPLHGMPEVYDLKSGRSVAVLEKDSYLTYVTQVGEYIITEYVSAAGDRYGLLLDDRLQTLAYLPGLCDISDGMLVFDYKSGNLRQCRLYSLPELMALGESYIK